MTTLRPQDRPRRSFLYRKLVALNAQFLEVDGAAMAERIGARDEGALARTLALADVSPLPRIGFKGAGAADWLASQGLSVPDINRLAQQADGSMVLRLGANDIMVTTGLDAASTRPATLLAAWQALENPPASPRGFPVPRQEGYCALILSGAQAASCLAKLCGVDLRPHRFEDGAIAQTSVARLSAVIARSDLNGTLAYRLYADSASAEYWWDCLIDAMQEFGGGVVGIAALRSL